jgi:hypothetical protein
MHKKNISLFLFSFLLAIMLISFASSAVTILSPGASATLSGTSILNATNSTADNYLNCTFYAKSASTANSSWTTLGFFTNNTIASVNGTFNSAILEDSNDYIFNATCHNTTSNGTLGIFSTTRTGITINNTVPQAPSSLTPDSHTSLTSAQTVTFSVVVTDRNTTGCTYTISRGGASSGEDYYTGTATYSGTNCSFTKTFSTQSDSGSWVWSIIASDGVDTLATSGMYYDVAIQTVTGNLAVAQANAQALESGTLPTTQTQKSNNNVIWIIIAIIIVIALVIYLIFFI